MTSEISPVETRPPLKKGKLEARCDGAPTLVVRMREDPEKRLLRVAEACVGSTLRSDDEWRDAISRHPKLIAAVRLAYFARVLTSVGPTGVIQAVRMAEVLLRTGLREYANNGGGPTMASLLERLYAAQPGEIVHVPFAMVAVGQDVLSHAEALEKTARRLACDDRQPSEVDLGTPNGIINPIHRDPSMWGTGKLPYSQISLLDAHHGAFAELGALAVRQSFTLFHDAEDAQIPLVPIRVQRNLNHHAPEDQERIHHEETFRFFENPQLPRAFSSLVDVPERAAVKKLQIKVGATPTPGEYSARFDAAGAVYVKLPDLAPDFLEWTITRLVLTNGTCLTRPSDLSRILMAADLTRVPSLRGLPVVRPEVADKLSPEAIAGSIGIKGKRSVRFAFDPKVFVMLS
jgi:hypothetical protein